MGLLFKLINRRHAAMVEFVLKITKKKVCRRNFKLNFLVRHLKFFAQLEIS